MKKNLVFLFYPKAKINGKKHF